MATSTSPLPLSRAPWSLGLSRALHLHTLPLHANALLLSALTYQTLFSLISPPLSRQLAPKSYPSFPLKTRLNWDTRVTGLVQAVFICTAALRVIASDPTRVGSTWETRLWGYSPAAGKVQAWAAGYFLWDILISARWVDMYGPTALMHAVAAFVVTMIGFVCIFCMVHEDEVGTNWLTGGVQRPFGNYYGVNFVLYELSTPFLNLHWMLNKLSPTPEEEPSDLQVYNGVALVGTFFGCRLVWGTYQTWLLTQDMLSAWRAGPVPELLFGTYLLANTALTGLNFFWFSKMVGTLRKRLGGRKGKDS
ncbi:hypothetical protein B0A48_00022 [Cryoendolithus antarcticus]|uniref:TLC domain-containing protein n=1 Tax=Cryoendolithus antarcticus TaxID=1507870 RepID=A0A1V8TTJ0_9PEZI|nr:hypothetical protein B0A48_00022 [Cryoendolithus antarcticus]